MRISDWSSDVCSSDLRGRHYRQGVIRAAACQRPLRPGDDVHRRGPGHRRHLRACLMAMRPVQTMKRDQEMSLDRPKVSECDGIRYLHFDSEWMQGAMRLKIPYE